MGIVTVVTGLISHLLGSLPVGGLPVGSLGLGFLGL
jgi:hypothetical protein